MQSSMLSVTNRSITEIHHLLKNGQLNVVELFEACLLRINQTKQLNCFITVTEEEARQQAILAEQRFKNGMDNCNHPS